jgi:hypothetical protein
MGLSDDLGPGPTAVDTAVFIHYIEENEAYLPLVAAIFEDVARGSTRGCDLQLAAALSAGCSTFVTTDCHLPQIPWLDVVQLGS